MLALSDRTIDWADQRVRFPDGRSLPLTTRERELMAFLADRPNQAVSRETLLHEVWKVRSLNTRAVDVTLSRLRHKVEAAPDRPVHLLSIHQVGYKFVPGVFDEPVPRAPPGGIPVPPGLLFGRTSERDAVERAWDAGKRLVTLVGTAGAGKSRVALELARTLDERGVSVRWVPLGEARTATDLASAVGAALGTPLVSDEARLVDTVGQLLRRCGPTTLFLDGFEALTAHGPALTRWLDTAVGLRVVVATRVRLRIAGEHVVDVGPLPLDDARALFLARVAEAGLDPLSPESADALIDRLERLPLALEVAAPRAGSPTELAGAGRSLRAMLDHSFGLLRPAERRALAWCSTFAGGFGLDAAESVLSELGESWPIDLLEALCDASLVRLDLSASDPRYHLYDAVREHAADHLRASGEAPAAEAAHARTALAHGAVLSDGIERHGGLAKLGELARELDNLVAAYRRSLPSAPETAIRIVVALEPLLASRGPTALLEALTDEVLADPRPFDPDLMARILCIRAEIARVRGHRALFRDLSHRASVLAVPGSETEVRATIGLALVAHGDGDLSAARTLGERALRLATVGGHRNFEAVVCGILAGWSASDGDLAAGLQGFRRAVRIALELGNSRREAVDRTNSATILREQCALEEAEREVEAAVAVHRAWGNRRRLGFALQLLGMIRAEQGHVDQGLAAATEAAAVLRIEGYPLAEVMGIQELAILRWMAGDPPSAVALQFADAARQFRELGQPGWEGTCLAWQAAALIVDGDLVGAEPVLIAAEARVTEDRPFAAWVRRLLEAGGTLRTEDRPGSSQIRLLLRVLDRR